MIVLFNLLVSDPLPGFLTLIAIATIGFLWYYISHRNEVINRLKMQNENLIKRKIDLEQLKKDYDTIQCYLLNSSYDFAFYVINNLYGRAHELVLDGNRYINASIRFDESVLVYRWGFEKTTVGKSNFARNEVKELCIGCSIEASPNDMKLKILQLKQEGMRLMHNPSDDTFCWYNPQKKVQFFLGSANNMLANFVLELCFVDQCKYGFMYTEIQKDFAYLLSPKYLDNPDLDFIRAEEEKWEAKYKAWLWRSNLKRK